MNFILNTTKIFEAFPTKEQEDLIYTLKLFVLAIVWRMTWEGDESLLFW
jgi:hypothetical protein